LKQMKLLLGLLILAQIMLLAGLPPP